MLVIDTGNNARSASAGDLMIGRLKVRGCAGIVTDGGFRDIAGVIKVGLPAYQRRASPPATPIGLHSADLDVPIGCAGVAVYPGTLSSAKRWGRGASGWHSGGVGDGGAGDCHL